MSSYFTECKLTGENSWTIIYAYSNSLPCKEGPNIYLFFFYLGQGCKNSKGKGIFKTEGGF